MDLERTARVKSHAELLALLACNQVYYILSGKGILKQESYLPYIFSLLY